MAVLGAYPALIAVLRDGGIAVDEPGTDPAGLLIGRLPQGSTFAALPIAACAADSLAIGTRKGEQET